ncbi:MAG: hypothetical protein D3920_04470 [Candidatus Electrothrix sp. AW2]|nr:hypothetical protein [Candidatus Electrothrix sp. AX1]MCI5116565.1 hypothetical protein [Candidatus Electrothrix gigas]MCI5127754.1 hypothetical protein [Candidatus Electrothrix gigas]MCI5134326.1 hypothetical protein [Candidatus Electrothrix gigas]MCI5178225.1 hypothetical protein [Candidatus Electrothrix gigas]
MSCKHNEYRQIYCIVVINREYEEDEKSEIQIFGTDNFFIIVVSVYCSGGYKVDNNWTTSIP